MVWESSTAEAVVKGNEIDKVELYYNISFKNIQMFIDQDQVGLPWIVPDWELP